MSRRSRRSLVRAKLKDALGWLNYATAPAFVGFFEGLPRTRRPSLASGALHAITPILLSGEGQPRAWRCAPAVGTVEQIAVVKAEPLLNLRVQAQDLLPGALGCDLVVLIADGAVFDAAYEHWVTLAWRDAGSLLQTLALSATALGLGFCPLGILGGEALQGLGATERFRALGVAVVGI